MKKLNLINPTISIPCFNIVYDGIRYAILRSYRSFRSIVAPYYPYLFLGEYSIVSPLKIPINIIICLCSKKKMCWIYTGWIITLMKYIETIRDRPNVKFPRYSMGIDSPPFSIQDSIPRSAVASNPKPTSTIRFWNDIFLKTFRNRGKAAFLKTLTTAILSAILIVVIHKGFLARETNKGLFHNYQHLRIGVFLTLFQQRGFVNNGI